MSLVRRGANARTGHAHPLPGCHDESCWYYAYAAAAEVGPQAAVRPGWNEVPEPARYNRDSHSADKPIRGPLMVLAGDDDASVSFPNIRTGVARACRKHLPIEFVHRPGLDHDPLKEKTSELQLDWVRARLEGRPWSGNCGPTIRPDDEIEVLHAKLLAASSTRH